MTRWGLTTRRPRRPRRSRASPSSAQSAALIDPQAILAKLRQVGTLPMRAKTNAAGPTAEFDPLHTVLVFDGTGACDQRDVPSAVARDRRQTGALGPTAPLPRTADHRELSRQMGAEQLRLIEDGIGGTADQRAEAVEVETGIAAFESARRRMIVLESAIRQERAAVLSRQPELAVQQEIAAMETYVVAMLHQGCAVLSVVAENGTEDVER